MTEVRFYHLQGQALEEALPRLVEKICGANLRAVIKAPDPELRDRLDRALWDYDPTSFLAHGTQETGFSDLQPIYLTTMDENPADATVQLSVNAINHKALDGFDRCLFMFDGRDEVVVANARTAWKAIKETDMEMSYWQQKETGGWEQKA